jgi:hypothetical protein
MYQYTDSRGTICMTNRLENVPPTKRKGVKVIREESRPQSPIGETTRNGHQGTDADNPMPATADKAAAMAATTPAVASSSPPWQKFVAAGIGVALLLVGICRLTRTLSSPQLAKVIYVAFFLGIFVFSYKLYADHLVNGYFAIKGKFLSLFAKAQQREGLATPRTPPGVPEP